MSQYYKFGNLRERKAPCHIKKACVKVEGGTISTCENRVESITALTTGAVSKVPVVLAQLTVQIDVNSIIDLPEEALEVKRIKKHLKVTQCLLIQDTNKLFIKGFIRKNIEYATVGRCSSYHGVCGDIRHCTVDTPFQCVTPVIFNGIDPLPLITSTNEEFVYSSKKELKGPKFAEKDKLLSADLSEFNQISTEYYNELPYCELVSSRIVEFDEFLGRKKPDHREFPVGEKLFKKIEEKMVIYLTLKLLQNRQVAIGPLLGAFKCEENE